MFFSIFSGCAWFEGGQQKASMTLPEVETWSIYYQWLKVLLVWIKSSLVAQRLKRLPPMWETRVRSLGWEDPLEKEMVTYSSILAWRIPQTEKPGRLQSMGSQRVGHDWVTSPSSVWIKVPSSPLSPETDECNLKQEKGLQLSVKYKHLIPCAVLLAAVLSFFPN